MTRIFLFALVAASMVMQSGCTSRYSATAKTLSVTYMSDPPGAVLYEGSKRWGYTPITLQYNITSDDRKKGQMKLNGLSVAWISGATAKVEYITADMNKYGLNQSFTFSRPMDVAGREKDEQFGLQTETLRAQKEASEYQQLLLLMQQQNQSMQQSPVNRPSNNINCTSTTYIPGQINTYCH